MSGYISFTDEEKTRACEADIVSLLELIGETVKKAGREYEWFDNNLEMQIMMSIERSLPEPEGWSKEAS